MTNVNIYFTYPTVRFLYQITLVYDNTKCDKFDKQMLSEATMDVLTTINERLD